MWYAVLMNREDTDWGTGSHDYNEAVRMGQETGADEIAVIDESGDPVCVDVIKLTYYWVDCDYHGCAVPAFALIRGLLDEEDGQKLRETEEVIFWSTYEDLGVDPTADDVQPGWDKMDEFIREQIGFLPDYEIN